MERRSNRILLAFAVVSLVSVAGCARSRPVRYYLLSPLAAMPDMASAPMQFERCLLVEYAVLPKYLDRPQILVHHSQQEVRPLDFHRWAEPLEDGLTRTLAENLTALLPAWQIISPLDAELGEPDGVLYVQVIRLYAGGDEVRFVTNWHIRANNERIAPVPARRTEFREALKSDDPKDMVAAFDLGVLELGKEIAATLMMPGVR